jgi:hypothetical protein
MKRDRASYEVFPAKAVMAGGRVRVAWAWQQIARSGTVRHAVLYDTLEECFAAIKRRCRLRAMPAVRVILDPAEASPAKA